MTSSVFESGKMQFGCNYWASHAGIEMWSDWQPQEIERDFQLLQEHNLELLRIFPLWNEFQPLERLYSAYNEPVELSFRGRPFPHTPAGEAGIDEVMVGRMRCVLDLADQYHLKVIVGLITGWMSGRMFAPPAFAGRNLIADIEVIRWQEKMVKFLVRSFRQHPAIIAWEPGNECNAMSHCTRDQAWLWLQAITRTIREEDSSRPVLSGMHSLSEGDELRYSEATDWLIADQRDAVDFFTTHPYPLCVPHAQHDGLLSFRNAFHAAAEGCFYSDLGGHPCLCEEFGTLSPIVGGDEAKQHYVRKAVNNLWAHDGRAVLWWCAFDQDHLDYAPYEWNASERQLGMFSHDRIMKPFAAVLTETVERLQKMVPEGLPLRQTDAVVFPTRMQDKWGNGWSSFLLAKQAGFDVRFAALTLPIPESGLYILPGVIDSAVDRRYWDALLERVSLGATLFLSMDDTVLCPFPELLGVESFGWRDRTETVTFEYKKAVLKVDAARQVLFGNRGPKLRILAKESDGNPVFMSVPYGKGEIYVLTVPLEKHLAKGVDLFTLPYYRIYECFASKILSQRALRSMQPGINVTLHPTDVKHTRAVVVNNQETTGTFVPCLAPGWQLLKVTGGAVQGKEFCLQPGECMMINLEHR